MLIEKKRMWTNCPKKENVCGQAIFSPLSLTSGDALFLCTELACVAGVSDFFWLGNFLLRFNKTLSYVHNSLWLSVIINDILNLRIPLSQDVRIKRGFQGTQGFGTSLRI